MGGEKGLSKMGVSLDGSKKAFSAIFLLIGISYFVLSFLSASPPFGLVFSFLNTVIIGDILAFAVASLVAIVFFHHSLLFGKDKKRSVFLPSLFMSIVFLWIGFSFLISILPLFEISFEFSLIVFIAMLARQFILVWFARKSVPKLKEYLDDNFFAVFATLAFALVWFAILFYLLYILLTGFWTYNNFYFLRLFLGPIGLFYFWAHTAYAKRQFVGIFKKLRLEPMPFGEIKLRKLF